MEAHNSMPEIFQILIRKWWIKLLAVIVIFPLSFMLTDYYSRGYLYYSKRVVNTVFQLTWQQWFVPTGPVYCYMKVVVDQDYRQKHPDWDPRIRAIVKRADDQFAAEFNIHLRVDTMEAWERPNGLMDFSEMITYGVKNISRGNADVLVIMTGRELDLGEGSHWVDMGVAHYLGNCILVGDDDQFMHEVGHLYGAMDYAPGDPGFQTESIYSYKYIRKTRKIDSLNHDRILAHKYRLVW